MNPIQTDIPLLEQPRPDLEPIYICNPCLEQNLLTAIHIRDCKQCGRSYCIHATSVLDPQYCVHCLHDVSVEIRMFRAPIGTSGATKATKTIKFGGTHYLFHHRKMIDMTDTELDLALEYHVMIYRSMVFEKERRKLSKMHRNVGVPYIIKDATSTATAKTSKVSKAVASKLKTVASAGVSASTLGKLSPRQQADLLVALQNLAAKNKGAS